MRGIKAALKAAVFCCAAIMLVDAASAQSPDNYPNRPIRIIVPYPAGGIVDIVARAVTEQVGRDLKTPIVVEARAGGNSNIGTSAVARSEPDGYTWLVTGPAVLVNPGLYKDAGWDVKDFRCVGLAVWTQAVAVVHPSMPVKTIGEFVEYARARPGQLNFGNPGTGSSIDLSAQKLFQAANIQLTNVGYKGQPQALTRPDEQSDAFRDRLDGAGVAAYQGRATSSRWPCSPTTASPTCPMCRRSRKPAMPARPMCPGTASTCRRRRQMRWRKKSTRRSTTPCKTRMCSGSCRSDIPGKPMSLAELAALVKSGSREAERGGEDRGDVAAVDLLPSLPGATRSNPRLCLRDAKDVDCFASHAPE